MNQQIELVNEVQALVAEVDRTHRYSMSRIYTMANRVFGTNEVPQSCSSCLIRKVRMLRAWLGEQATEEAVQAESVVVKKRGRKKVA